MAAVVADDPLALDRRAELHGRVLLIKNAMTLHLQRPARLLEQLQVLVVGHHSLSEINGAIDDALLLLALQDAGDDGLGGDTVAPAVKQVMIISNIQYYITKDYISGKMPPSKTDKNI